MMLPELPLFLIGQNPQHFNKTQVKARAEVEIKKKVKTRAKVEVRTRTKVEIRTKASVFSSTLYLFCLYFALYLLLFLPLPSSAFTCTSSST
jgi:hypothetical protein